MRDVIAHMAVNVAQNNVSVVTQWASTVAGVDVPALRQVAVRYDRGLTSSPSGLETAIRST